MGILQTKLSATDILEDMHYLVVNVKWPELPKEVQSLCLLL